MATMSTERVCGARRCSKRKIPCQVPSASLPPTMGITSLVRVIAIRRWLVVSSGPSSVCVYAGVMAWLRENEREIYVSTITIGELRRGIERLPEGSRKTKLRHWLQSLCDCMKGRVLTFSTSSAHVWGQLKAKWDAAGIVMPTLDSQSSEPGAIYLSDFNVKPVRPADRGALEH